MARSIKILIAFVVSFVIGWVGLSWVTRNVTLLVGCRLSGIGNDLNDPSQMFRTYDCDGGFVLAVPVGKFPRVPGPGEDLPI